MVAIGIDLGTAYCCVAVWRHGCVEVICNEHGNRTTPSFVAFNKRGRLIGEDARNQAAYNAENTVFGVKRLIGRRYDDNGVQSDLHQWPFQLQNTNGKPMILVKYRGVNKLFAPEEISAMVLSKIKAIAESYLDVVVDKAVITVPAYFNYSQRQATRNAGIIAGFEVLRISNEPTAAALAYGLNKNGKKNVLIFDLGGGTLDVSVLSINGTTYEVKSTSGNTRLGGQDFDNRIVAYFAEDFMKKHGIDLMGRLKSLRRLKTEAEKAKKFLTSYPEATVQVESLYEDIDYCGKISRAHFEDICFDLFNDILGPVKKALCDARFNKMDIDNIVLVGGSSRMPKIHHMLKKFFDGRNLTTSLNPDEAVACGAAIQAAILNDQSTSLKEYLLIDVVPLSLGIELPEGVMCKLIERNTPIPCQKIKEMSTFEDYQTSLMIEIFEGERSLTKDNNLLGSIVLQGLPAAPRGVVKIDIAFSINADGILSVTAIDKNSINVKTIIIQNEQRIMNPMEIQRMISDAATYKQDDLEDKRRLETRNQFETYVYDVRRTVEEHEKKLTEKEKAFMKEDIQRALQWLDENTLCLSEENEMQTTVYMNRWFDVMRKINGLPWERNRHGSDSSTNAPQCSS